jgi:hypothetical protein
MSEVWAHAEHDEALLAMLHEDEDAALGLSTPSEALDEAELARAQDRFVHRMQQAQPEPAPRPQVLASTGNTSALTVSEVVEAMEREAQRSGAQPPEAASWRRVLEPVRSSREALPSHITAKAMSDFWSRVGLAVPRDVAAAFSHAARLLLMGRAAPQGRLSLARSARPAGISHEVERLAAQASNADAPDTQAAESARPNTDSTPPREDAST